MAYNDIISRVGGTDALVPEPYSAQIIQEMPQSSAVLARARRVPMSTKTNRMPVLSTLPQGYFVNGDTGLKQTTKAEWENLTLVAEELAVIVPVPQAYLDDAAIPIWSEVAALVRQAFGQKIDAATLFGQDKPATWGDAIVPASAGAGNIILEGSGDDLAQDVSEAARLVAEDGFPVDGFVASPGFRWKLVGLRSGDGIPIYAPPAGAQPGTLYGYPLNESLNGGFDTDIASLVLGDWSKAIVGLRQDITFHRSLDGIISDGDGKVVLNALQQDSVLFRFVMRLAWQVANPVTPANASDGSRFPFASVVPSSSQYS